MSGVHPQVAAVLERVAQSPLPPYYEVPPAVARRLYRDSRGALTPDPPAVESVQLLMAPGKAGPVPIRGYRPKGAGKDEVLPALVYFHGGGWVIGDLDTHDVVCRTLCNGARCAVFSVEYRKAPEAPFPAAVDDCFSALSFVFSNAKSFNANAKQIAVGGDSAGGNLATVMALMARDGGGPAIAFQLLIYPGVDQRMQHASIKRNGEGYLLTEKSMHYFRGHYLPEAKDWLDWRASPLLAKSLAKLPPAFVLTAGFDPLVDEGREYAERMRKEGVPVEYKNYADMVHGFITMGRVLDTANTALAGCAAALRKAWSK
ncbi:MAG TPA: alpha/beta hydrolase [Burkholderiales bacterium]|jgi:acetyl esterase|nr:alpha/beta hydrolase [Burkholderiales bacterium]